MKRLVVLAVLFSLAISFAALQPAPASAQNPNCYFLVKYESGYGDVAYYRIVLDSSGAVVSNVLTLNDGQEGVLVVKPGTVGAVKIQGSRDNFATFFYNYPENVDCRDNNGEFGKDCRLGVDFYHVYVALTAVLRLKVFKNEQKVLTRQYSNLSWDEIEVVIPTDNDPNAYYSYELRCINGVCQVGEHSVTAGPAPGTLVKSGPLTYLCTSACGPSLAGAPLGRMLATVPLHAAPNAGAASPTFSAEAGKTFKMLGTQGGFTRIALGCQSYWVPSDAIAQCADPLCRD